ncbi:MAG: sugar phosphate isomerase/epimerase family protein [Eubacteriales bacterium]|nr:sugar phosphate isomerase/epimerase family protein [Eubacteriales bacterium]
MRFGCCINMLADREDPIGLRWLPLLKQNHYDYVELPLAQVMDLDDTAFENLRRTLWQLSLPCACCNNFFPAFLRLTGDAPAPDGVVRAYLEKALERVSLLGAKKVIFGSSGAKNIPEGFPYEKAYEQIVRLLGMAAGTADAFDITIGIEPLNYTEGNLIRTMTESRQLMRDVCSERVRLMVDYYHFCMENEKKETLRDCMSDVIHVHLASPTKRVFPGQDELFFLSFLQNMGYDKEVSIEAYSSNPQKDLAAAINILS